MHNSVCLHKKVKEEIQMLTSSYFSLIKIIYLYWDLKRFSINYFELSTFFQSLYPFVLYIQRYMCYIALLIKKRASPECQPLSQLQQVRRTRTKRLVLFFSFEGMRFLLDKLIKLDLKNVNETGKISRVVYLTNND